MSEVPAKPDAKPDLATRMRQLAQALSRPTSWVLLGLGFSCALPYLLIGGTLNFWMRGAGISLTVISMMGWVSLFYGLKVVWAPWMDKVRLPFLHGWLGQRRSYMLLSQAGIAAGLVAMALTGPSHLAAFILSACFVAFAAASQEIAVDAWRVEHTGNEADQALFPSLYSYGFRAGILMTDSLILVISKRTGWPEAYMVMAGTLVLGATAALFAQRTAFEAAIDRQAKTMKALLIEPFVSFFNQHRGTAGLILLTLALYRLPDYLTNIAPSLYQDLKLDPDAIAATRASIGLWASLIGIGIGGTCLLTLGLQRTFWLGALLGPVSNICFSWMAVTGGELRVFAATLVADNVSNGIAETAFVAFLTRMTGRDHTLTHYALMYSVAAMTGKVLKGFTGLAVDSLKGDMGLFNAYSAFFAATAAIGLPCLFLCWLMGRSGVWSYGETK
ncbi:MAG: permease [Asticcacaulis sp.]|nr:permease [Asticcacaulis sp.]